MNATNGAKIELIRTMILGSVLLAALGCITALGILGAVDKQVVSTVFGGVVGGAVAAVGTGAGAAIVRNSARDAANDVVNERVNPGARDATFLGEPDK